MVDQSQYAALSKLNDDVLAELVREAEERLRAQLQVAAASDQGTLSIASVQVASGTAALAGGVGIALTEHPDYWIAGLAIGFSVGMAFVAHWAISSLGPEGFNMPGHRPLHWHPERWLDSAESFTLKQARVEQAVGLEDEIEGNNRRLELTGKKVRQSIRWWIALVSVAALLLILIMVARNVTVRMP